VSRPANPFALRGQDIARVVALGLAQAATLVAFLLLTIYVVNAFTPETVGAEAVAERNRALTALGLLVVVALLHGWLRAAEFSVAEKVGYEVIRRLRMTMYAHLQGMTPREFQHRARGGMLLRFIGDLSMLRTWLSRGLLGGLTASIVLVAMLATLIVLNHWVGLSIIAVLGAGAAVSLSIGRRMRRATRVMRRRRSLLIGNIDEQMNSLPVIQVFGRARGEYARLSRQNDSLNQALFRIAELRGRLRGIASATGLLAVVAVMTVGMLEVRRGDATLGLVLGAILATRQLNVLVRTLGLSHDYWHRARVSRQKVQDFLDSSSRGLAPEGLDRLLVRRGRIELRDVTVPGALTAITVTAQAGQLVAVTGGSGAGKSTLLRLLSRLVDPSDGEVLVDGQSLAGTTPQSSYRYIGVVSPDLPLMRGSVRRNLTYGTRGVADVEVQRVVHATGLAEVLADLPDGIDTWVTEGGRNLSLAQRQRIALARALMGNPTILLLDRPTAGLDEASRQAFHETLRRHQGTTLLATHDPDELALADQVWLLEAGRLTAASSGEERLHQLWLARQERDPWPHTAS
jgi:ATP-binding cassette subfamily B protein